MAVNYADKYASEIDERFKIGSLTDLAINQNYDFDGVNTVNIYSSDTVPLNDYDLAANNNRYGTPQELGNDVEGLVLSQDKSFTFTIDRRNNEDTMMTNAAGVALNREIREVIIPTVDKYRIGIMVSKAGTVLEQTITADNAYSSFLDASLELFDKEVPTSERIAFVTPAYYKFIKLDKAFTGVGDSANELAKKGVVGTVDNTYIVIVPTSYFPADAKINFLVTHPSATIGPMKLSEYKIHDNPPGINGWLVEGRIYYDAFVPKNKKNAILVSKQPSA